MKPPLPMASNFPFQREETGSQTSKLICESLVGAENATTRQKAFETLSFAAGPAGPAGKSIARSGGGLTAVADVTVAFGIESDVRLSQGCCASKRAGAHATTATQTTTHTSFPCRPM